jgi:uncharacterized cupin superfamily protein
MKPVVNIDDVPYEPSSKGDKYEERFAALGERVGARRLGYNVTIVPAGKRSCPFHNHHANEEMFFILAGEGTYRFGDGTYPVRAGDIIAAPAGAPETAHHLINTGTGDLKYLSVSTMNDPDVCEYPDSGKFAVYSGRPGKRHLTFIGRRNQSLDYYDGEI